MNEAGTVAGQFSSKNNLLFTKRYILNLYKSAYMHDVVSIK